MTANTPITLAELVAEGLAPNIDALAAQLNGQVFLDDIGRRAVTREVAREALTQHTAKQTRERERQQRQRAELQARGSHRAAETASRRARNQQQRELLAANPDLDALTVMRMASGDDGGLGRAGRRWDEFVGIQRRGDVGTMTTFPRPRKG